MEFSSAEESRIANYLIRKIVDKALGESQAECRDNYPRDAYFLGNLRPQEANTATTKVAARELLNKLAPSATGWEIALRLTQNTAALRVGLSWSVYYRQFPSFTQQRDYQVRSSRAQQTDNPGATAQGTPTDNLGSPPTTSAHVSKSKDSMAQRFKAVRCMILANVRIDTTTGPIMDIGPLQAAIDSELARGKELWQNDPERIRAKTDSDEYIQVPVEVLNEEANYKTFIDSLLVEVPPQWKLTIESEVTSNSQSDELVVGLNLVNTSSPTRSKDRENPNLEHFVFNPVFEFEVIGGTPLPFTIELAPRGFRYDRNLWGKGFNCAISRNPQNEQQFVTTHVPIYTQSRYSTRSLPPAQFADLVSDPLPVLDAIRDAMNEYVETWTAERLQYQRNDSAWERNHGSEFDDDFRRYKDEIARFSRGLELIRKDTDVRHAFTLTNETFRRGTKSGWRLFQIVFLVSQIPGTVALAKSADEEERRKVDIIYFPTGGGKTEAYLGVITFHCFYDRLRGKSAGVTAWTRFPLRLLTLQQTQRVADTIAVAEIVRSEQADKRLNGKEVDPFAIGYFVGEGGSPNEITDPTKVPYPDADMEITWAKATDPTLRQKWKRIARCPSCRTDTVIVDYNLSTSRLIHRCTEKTCKFPNGTIPVYVVDNEIYRFLPTVVVGTIDKLAGLGNQRKMALMLGRIEGKCLVHGYYRQKCCQKDCSDRKMLKKGVPNGISGPTLFIQDELHLIKEGLGTFDSHYETFTQALLNEFGATHDLKIIASSATIEAFERQVSHLYGRLPSDARVFPGPGPTLRTSFYAETLRHDQRLYVGLIPHNKTILNTILELLEYYHRAIYELRSFSGEHSPFGGATQPGTPLWNELVDLYATSLAYFIARNDLNPIRTDLYGHVFPAFEADGLPVPRVHELTGSTTTDEVQRSLEILERPNLDASQSDTVLATSMVSHGVDIDRLNAMIFYGMPRQNAEYIQASSRVGRAHVGIVFTCLHPIRERDQSHYQYFVKFHEFLGQLIEPVAINRWAKFSLTRTLPGLFMAILLQKFANELGETKPDSLYLLDFVRKKITARALAPDMFIPLLEKAYLVSVGPSVATATFKSEITRLVERFFDQIISAGPPHKFVSAVLIPKPLRSLRDVDEPIEVELDSDGTEWSRKTAAQRN
jgi:hypothetical protein